MKVGYAKGDITPPVGIRLGGYGHRFGKHSEFVHDPLVVSVIFLDSGNEEALLIHADVLGIYRVFADNVKNTIHDSTGIATDRMFFMTTHTHSGPETIVPMWPNTFPYSKEEKRMLDNWMNFFKEKTAEASVEAHKNASLTSIGAGASDAPNLIFNRSYKDGPIDTEVPIFFLRNKHKTITITDYCCHPVCNTDLGISADYPGQLYSNLAKQGIESFFTTGPTGNIDPVQKGREFILRMGSELSEAVIRGLNESSGLSSEKINVQRRAISLKVRNVEPLEEARKRFEGIYAECQGRFDDSECLTRLIYADEEYEVAKDYKVSVDTIVQALTIGNEVALISIPGELFVEFGMRIKQAARQIGYKYVIVSTYSEDYVGYIPVEKAFDLRTYEARLSRWSRVTSEAGEIMYREAIDCLR